MTRADLSALGWTDERAAVFAPDAARGLVAGRVTLEHNHVFRVQTIDGERLAETAGRLKHEADGREALPVVGDWVALTPGPGESRWLIRRILPRHTSIDRRAAGRQTRRQVLAANVDVALIVVGLDSPLNRRRLERYIVVARRPHLRSVVVLNKGDLHADPESVADEMRLTVDDATVLVASARTGQGLDELRRLLSPGRTAVLLGPSGVGKSSLANALVGALVLRTGAVRASDARGRHVSVHRQLLALPEGGAIIDTPGLREVQPWDSGESMADAFADIVSIGKSCRFRDCRHDQEPGCAVKAAVDAGTLDATRYGHFVKLERERALLAAHVEHVDHADARGRSGPAGAGRLERLSRTRVRR